MVLEITIQEADNGFVVITRKSGQQLSLTIEQDESAVGDRIKAEVAKHRSNNGRV